MFANSTVLMLQKWQPPKFGVVKFFQNTGGPKRGEGERTHPPLATGLLGIKKRLAESVKIDLTLLTASANLVLARLADSANVILYRYVVIPQC